MDDPQCWHFLFCFYMLHDLPTAKFEPLLRQQGHSVIIIIFMKQKSKLRLPVRRRFVMIRNLQQWFQL